MAAIFLAVAVISVSSFSLPFKLSLLAVVIVFCPGLYFSLRYFTKNRRVEIGSGQRKNVSSQQQPDAAPVFTAKLQEKLLALEEIGEFFGSTLKPADMFRLVGNRIAELLPFDGCFLFLANESGDVLKIAHAVSEDSVRFNGLLFNSKEGLPKKAASGNVSLSDADLPFDDKLFPSHFKVSIAAPIVYQNKKLGALALSSARADAYDDSSLKMLQAVTERISSLISNSFNNQRNRTNALTDMLTDLPNEAAFYLILEQQIAESQRFSQKHALTVLCMDIKDFSKINREYGHSAGDQLLTFTARIIKNQLRQMDFLAHPRADEFWAILPGASSNIVELVIERLDRAFTKSLFTLPSNPKIDIELHFGTATFKRDGETADELIRAALDHKSDEKSAYEGEMNSVIPFPLRNAPVAEHPF